MANTTSKEYHYQVYVLINETTPIYVGCTSCISTRVKAHRSRGKKFTDYVIVKSYDNKKDALIAENSLIRYLSIFGNPENVNGKFCDLSYSTMYKKSNK